MKTGGKSILLTVLAVVAITLVFVISRFMTGSSDSTHLANSGNEPGMGAQSAHFREAPAFELKDSKGALHHLSDFKGSAVVLHFWASWCPPCIDEIPQWVSAAKKYAGKPIQWVAVSVDQNWADALKILPDQNLPGNISSLIDVEGKLPDRYGTFQYPETYVITPDQKIVAKWVGPQNWGGDEISKLLDQLIAMIQKKSG